MAQRNRAECEMETGKREADQGRNSGILQEGTEGRKEGGMAELP